MAVQLEPISDSFGIRSFFSSIKLDPRTENFPLLGSPLFIMGLITSYLYFVYKAGPRMMEKRQAYDLRGVIKLYNLFMVVANIFFLGKFLNHSYLSKYNFFCQKMDHSTDADSLAIVKYAYLYLFVRMLDFIDTIFFVLRKKYTHVTLQHTLHHTMVVGNGYLFMSLGCDGQSMFGVCLNCAVHIIMYTYYFLAACGPQYRKYLWWKKYLTKIQIYQHLVIMAHGLIPVFYDCGYPKWFIYLCFPQGFLGLALFINFYAFAYGGKDSEGKTQQMLNHNVCILNDYNSEGSELKESGQNNEEVCKKVN